MTVRDSLMQAAQAVREYAKGIDRATVVRRAFAFWLVFTLVVSVVPPAVLYAGGPDISPIGVASADSYNTSELTHIKNQSVSPNTDSPTGFSYNDDGTKFFITDSNNDDIDSYELSDPYNITSASFKSSVDISGDSGEPTGLAWSGDGRKFYITDGFDNNIEEYDVSEAYNISTASHNSSLDVSSNAAGPEDLTFNDDGSKMYVINGTHVIEYDLSVAYDVSTATQTDTFASGGSRSDISWNDDGSKFFILDTDEVREYDISTKYDVSTASLANTAGLKATAAEGMGWSGTGENLSIVEPNIVQDYSAGSLTSVSGTVTYGSNKSAVEGASVSVNSSGASDTTDASGFYSISVSNGTHEITATKGDLSNSITVTVSGSALTNQNITLSDETLSLDVPTHMFPNTTASYEVTLEGSDVTDQANVTSSDPANLTVNQTSNELEATSDTSFAAEVTITAEHDGLTAERNVTVANLSAGNVALMQNAADMTAAIWGDVPDASTGDRPGGTQLTMRVLFVALLIGAAIATHASGFAGIGGVTLIVVMGWFMGWVDDGMAMVTVFTGLFIGLNLAANIDYSVRKG